MGDLMNNTDIFKKLGFDSSNQWIFYDERFEKFFSFFSENISDCNVLTEYEVLERDELLSRHEYLDIAERHKQLQLLESENPGLLEYKEHDVLKLAQDVRLVKQTEEAYAGLVEDMRCTKNQINYRLNDLEDSINVLINSEKELLASCQSKSKQLEDLQRENYKLCKEATKCFTKIQSPALFVHQLPIDQYFLRCDSFMQYFTLYMKENYKIQDYIELNNSVVDTQDFSAKLEKLEKSIEHYTLAHIKEMAKVKATQTLIDSLDLTQIHIISLTDMERETHELELINEHHLRSANETLMNDLAIHVKQRTQQRIELILYENTKQKLQRALKRHENDKRLTKIISDALSNAELIWITIQLDLEKKRNRCDNTEQLSIESEECWKRIKAMRNLSITAPANVMCMTLLGKMADQLSQHLELRVLSEPKAFFYEYEQFCRLSSNAMQFMLNKKTYANALEQVYELKRLESILNPLVYDSPVESPMFENVRFLMPIFNAKMKQQHLDKQLRNLRTQFQENITEKMDKEKLWRYSQLLWVWFLTEPRRVRMAIEEVKKVAAKVPSMTGVKSLSGIMRK